MSDLLDALRNARADFKYRPGQRRSTSTGLLDALRDVRADFNYRPDQRRDDHGRFADEGKHTERHGGHTERHGGSGAMPHVDRLSEDERRAAISYIKGAFPNMDRASTDDVIGRASFRYNCVADAVGDHRRWWWPESSSFWPEGVDRHEEVGAFDDLFLRKLGGTESTDFIPDYKPGEEHLALFVDSDGRPTHLARQWADNRWTSKFGEAHTLIHEIGDAEDGLYGSVGKVYVISRDKWQSLKNMR